MEKNTKNTLRENIEKQTNDAIRIFLSEPKNTPTNTVDESLDLKHYKNLVAKKYNKKANVPYLNWHEMETCLSNSSNGYYAMIERAIEAASLWQKSQLQPLIDSHRELKIALEGLLQIYKDKEFGDLVWRLAVEEKAESAIEKANTLIKNT